MLEVQECMFSVKGYISEFAVLKGEVRVKSWNLDKKIQLWSESQDYSETQVAEKLDKNPALFFANVTNFEECYCGIEESGWGLRF